MPARESNPFTAGPGFDPSFSGHNDRRATISEWTRLPLRPLSHRDWLLNTSILSWRQKSSSWCHKCLSWCPKYVMTTESLSWSPSYVMAPKSSSWRQKYIMTSVCHHVKKTPRRQEVYHDVKNTSGCQKISHYVKKFVMMWKTCQDVKSTSWRQTISSWRQTISSCVISTSWRQQICNDINKFVMMSKIRRNMWKVRHDVKYRHDVKRTPWHNRYVMTSSRHKENYRFQL